MSSPLPLRPLAAVLFSGLLAGCSLFGSSKPGCPAAGVLGDAGRVTAFRPGGGHDLTDVLYEARLTGAEGACTYDEDAKQVTVNLTVQASAKGGPANPGNAAPLHYFVAVVDPDNTVVARSTFPLTVATPPDGSAGTASDETVETIPLPSVRAGWRYKLYVGLVLDHDQVAYNRTHAAPVLGQ